MENSLQKRVRRQMDLLNLNALQAAKKAELGDSFVRDILRGKTRTPNAENLRKLAVALETTAEFLLGGNGEDSHQPKPIVIDGMTVLGSIQAGNWIDRSILDDSDDREVIPVARDPRFPRAKQYALWVLGDSMDKDYPDGSYVTCVDYWESGISLKDGLIIHVERHNGPLVEMTLKAVETIEGKMMLCPRSNNPRHKPIPLEGDSGTEVVIKGIVTGSYRRTLI